VAAVCHVGFDRKWMFTIPQPLGSHRLVHNLSNFNTIGQCAAESLMIY